MVPAPPRRGRRRTPAAAGAAVVPAPAWSNWGGTAAAAPAGSARPVTLDDVTSVVRQARRRGWRARAVGSGHSFTAAAVTDGLAIDLSRHRRLLAADPATGRVEVEAGITLRALSERLVYAGLALPNLGDIADQSVAGALATGTHGTGAALGGLATQVVALELVDADGEVRRCSAAEDPDLFAAARVGLGALGVVTAVALQAVPAFSLRADERVERIDDVLAGFEEAARAHDHWEAYWVPHTDLARTKRNDRTGEAPRGGAARRLVDRVVVENVALGAICRVERAWPALTPRLAPLLAAGGTRVLVDRSYRVFTSPRMVRFVEMEYALPRAALPGVVEQLRSVAGRRGMAVALPVELRVAAADDIWLSTAHGRDTGYVAVHQYRGMEHRRWMEAVEEVMVAAGGRPHWGKLHSRSAADLAGCYPRWADWQAVRGRLDPTGVWSNPYLDRVLGPAPEAGGYTSGQG